ncbi:hypothetical protein [Devosia sp.]|uniref:hypothetical protein n=1 Tax=Devosia sp. TaxID=1871048 RepID=UPI0025F39CE6|nr:hypothetical protein [Devosia sp.]MCR6633489.1 hypothetical protein [Devosia sp.]
MRDYWIKIDPEDLGAVSVLLGNDWTTIEGPTEFNSVRLDDWLLQKAKLRAIYTEQERIDFKEIVAPAIVELAQQAQALRAFHNIIDVEWTESKLRDLERNLRTFILYDRDAEGPEEALMGNSRMLGTIHTRNPGALPAPPSSALSTPSSQPDETASPATFATDIAQSPADRPERLVPPSESPESAPASTRRTRKHLPKSNPEN